MKTLVITMLIAAGFAAAQTTREDVVLYTTSENGITRVVQFDNPKPNQVVVEIARDGNRLLQVLDVGFKEASASWSKKTGYYKGQLVLVKKTDTRRVYALFFYNNDPKTIVQDYLTLMEYVRRNGLDQ